MRSDGQALALTQLDEIARASAGSLEVLEVLEPHGTSAYLCVSVSLRCTNFDRAEGGVPLKMRERLHIYVPSRFPWHRPSAQFRTNAHAGFPHVQWGKSICLYQAPEVEWVPNQGMFGFLERLNDWLKAAAANELDPLGAPLHPPVAYATSDYSVVPRVDAPPPTSPYWSGFVEVSREDEVAAELGRWIPYGEERSQTRLASAILLPTSMPFEYPATMLDLINVLEARAVPINVVRTIVQLGALTTPEGSPAVFVLGAAMRGVAGGETRQHLAAWVIGPQQSRELRNAALAATPGNPTDIDAFCAWASSARVEWCRVLEDRPEIVVRRDANASSAYWLGKRVAVLGCGAIGASVAAMLTRAGASRLELYDRSIVTPGILVRQDFRRGLVGHPKCRALRTQLLDNRPDLDVTAHHGDILISIEDVEHLKRLMDVDVIIDATASRTVAGALEQRFRTLSDNRPPVLTMVIGHNADLCLMTLATQDHTGLSLDVDRRTKLAMANTAAGEAYLNEFWPTAATRRTPFQPEPGCSDATFRGAYADVLGLTSRMTNIAATWLSGRQRGPRSFALNLSGGGLVNGPAREVEYSWRPYHLYTDPNHAFQIRVTEEAMVAMLAWARRSERVHGSRVETGGVLFGECDDVLKLIWVDEVSGPPPDSMASRHGFVCGTAGVHELSQEKAERTRGSVHFVGMWHTHPHSPPLPSSTDLGAMRCLLTPESGYHGKHFLMMILGGTSMHRSITATVFHRSDYGD